MGSFLGMWRDCRFSFLDTETIMGHGLRLARIGLGRSREFRKESDPLEVVKPGDGRQRK